MSGYRYEDFSGTIGEPYDLPIGDDASLKLVLEHAEELPQQVREEGCFRLEFRGPFEPILPQAIYRLVQGGRDFDIFIVPIGRDEKSVVYEAVFN
jgi:hypothetical protein